jgi:hydrogenase maturation protease
VELSVDDARRLALDDQLCARPVGRVVVIGCGNLLRGDDAVGPTLVRHLWERGVPGDVVLVDGGTAGMDVAFKMRGAERVVIVDAAVTGAEPGTIYRVPGEELEDLPALDGLHTHQFRWDHALSFGRWLLQDAYPSDITVFLIEAAQLDHGAPLSPPVAEAMERVGDLVRAVWEGTR